MTRAVQRSSRLSCSSRAGSVPMATRTLRRCSTGLPAGSSSRARWVSCFPASSRKIAGAALLFSHASTVAAYRYMHAVDGRDAEIAAALSKLAAEGTAAKLPRTVRGSR